MTEHPVHQTIVRATIWVGSGAGETYCIGIDRVTRIEACTKSGMHAYIPYIRIWSHDDCLAEFCQHNILGVYFGELGHD